MTRSAYSSISSSTSFFCALRLGLQFRIFRICRGGRDNLANLTPRHSHVNLAGFHLELVIAGPLKARHQDFVGQLVLRRARSRSERPSLPITFGSFGFSCRRFFSRSMTRQGLFGLHDRVVFGQFALLLVVPDVLAKTALGAVVIATGTHRRLGRHVLDFGDRLRVCLIHADADLTGLNRLVVRARIAEQRISVTKWSFFAFFWSFAAIASTFSPIQWICSPMSVSILFAASIAFQASLPVGRRPHCSRATRYRSTADLPPKFFSWSLVGPLALPEAIKFWALSKNDSSPDMSDGSHRRP